MRKLTSFSTNKLNDKQAANTKGGAYNIFCEIYIGRQEARGEEIDPNVLNRHIQKCIELNNQYLCIHGSRSSELHKIIVEHARLPISCVDNASKIQLFVIGDAFNYGCSSRIADVLCQIQNFRHSFPRLQVVLLSLF